MAKYELSLVKSYVQEWTAEDAIREIIQNAIDESNRVEDNAMSVEYDPEVKTLIISNKKSVLTHDTLLLGNTSKATDDNMIGKFGEGYKLGILVLTRENHPVVIQNYGLKETWKARFVNSRRWKDEVLTIFTDKSQIWNKPPHNNLSFVINNVDQDMYNEVVKKTLFLKDIYTGEYVEDNYAKTSYGNILFEESEKGRVYVNGLFVTTLEDLKYGYDIKTKYIEIGRDRNLIDSYKITKYTTLMWMYIQDDFKDEIFELAYSEALDFSYDTEYVSIPETGYENISHVYAESKADWLSVINDVSSFSQKYYQDLKDKYGDDVLFYNNSDELAKTISENTEYLSYKYLDEIKKLPEYIEKLDEAKELSLAIIEEKSLEECIVDLEEWCSDNCNSDDEEGYKLQLIISSLKNIADKDKLDMYIKWGD